jgi:hypothetical protein
MLWALRWKFARAITSAATGAVVAEAKNLSRKARDLRYFNHEVVNFLAKNPRSHESFRPLRLDRSLFCPRLDGHRLRGEAKQKTAHADADAGSDREAFVTSRQACATRAAGIEADE